MKTWAIAGMLGLMAMGCGDVSHDYQLIGMSDMQAQQVARALKTWNNGGRIVEHSRNTIEIADEEDAENGNILPDDYGDCSCILENDHDAYTQIYMRSSVMQRDVNVYKSVLHELGHSIRFLDSSDLGACDVHAPKGNIMFHFWDKGLTGPTDYDYEFVGTTRPTKTAEIEPIPLHVLDNTAKN